MPGQLPGSGNRVNHIKPALKKYKQYKQESRDKNRGVYKCMHVDVHRQIESENPHHLAWPCSRVRTINDVYVLEGIISQSNDEKNAMVYACLQLLCIMQPSALGLSKQDSCDIR